MHDDVETECLIRRVEGGDQAAAGELIDRHRERLRRMVSFRLDPRVSARVDASDVVQDAMAEAVQKLPEYLSVRPVPFYSWLRQIAWQRLVRLHEYHLYRQRRSILIEQGFDASLSDASRIKLARQLVASGSGPSTIMRRDEQLVRVEQAISRLRSNHREVLLLRYVEQLTVPEIAAVLDISEAAVKMRHIRALDRLREHLAPEDSSAES